MESQLQKSSLKGPFKGNFRLQLVDSAQAKSENGIMLGTYGIIRNASLFLASSVQKGEKDLEELGYLFEKAVLYMTSLGLGTCWLGGTFTKGEFAKALALKPDEMLLIVSPVGYIADRQRMIEKVMRLGAGSHNRKEWKELFFQSSFDQVLSEADAGKYTTPLEMVRLAPSARNKQPWRIVKDNGKFHFYLQHTKGYSKALGYDIQRVDIGIAMCHFELTVQELGLAGHWQVQSPVNIRTDEATEYIVNWVEE